MQHQKSSKQKFQKELLEINPSVEYITGTTNVLLTAPHSQNHKRPNLMGTYKHKEPCTDEIVRAICNETGAHGIVLSKTVDFDPNWHPVEKNPFKETARQLVESGVEYIFDIHGLSDQHSYDLGIYYMSRFRKSKKIGYELANTLNQGELNGVLFQMLNFADGRQETITEYLISNYKIAGLQLEIARYIREDELLQREFIRLFSEFIKKL